MIINGVNVKTTNGLSTIHVSDEDARIKAKEVSDFFKDKKMNQDIEKVWRDEFEEMGGHIPSIETTTQQFTIDRAIEKAFKLGKLSCQSKRNEEIFGLNARINSQLTGLVDMAEYAEELKKEITRLKAENLLNVEASKNVVARYESIVNQLKEQLKRDREINRNLANANFDMSLELKRESECVDAMREREVQANRKIL
jgi:hypothetical protein